jgi:threonine dehydrogenase-like Zn-dependent dehydrogenase
MRAVTWQGKRHVSVEEVPDPRIEQPTDAIVKITSTNICGSDLHLYETLGPFMDRGDILGHEPMGIVQEVGSEVGDLKVGDRVVLPFQISCGHCWMCRQGLYTQCETTQVRDQGSGAALFGYSKLYGQVPGGQAEYLRVPQAQFSHIKVPEGPSDDRFVYLSDVLPTAWQAVTYAECPADGTLLVLGLGPIGDMSCRIALHNNPGRKVIGVDLVPERLARAKARGVEVIDLSEHGDDLLEVVQSMTDGRGADAVIDAVGLDAHGSPGAKLAQTMAGLLPDAIAQPVFKTGGVDKLAALYSAIELVRRGGTISLSGVYGGMADPMPMMTLFDKQIQLRMGQANVLKWVPDILPLEEAPHAYEIFQNKEDGCVKVVLNP